MEDAVALGKKRGSYLALALFGVLGAAALVSLVLVTSGSFDRAEDAVSPLMYCDRTTDNKVRVHASTGGLDIELTGEQLELAIECLCDAVPVPFPDWSEVEELSPNYRIYVEDSMGERSAVLYARNLLQRQGQNYENTCLLGLIKALEEAP